MGVKTMAGIVISRGWMDRGCQGLSHSMVFIHILWVEAILSSITPHRQPTSYINLSISHQSITKLSSPMDQPQQDPQTPLSECDSIATHDTVDAEVFFAVHTPSSPSTTPSDTEDEVSPTVDAQGGLQALDQERVRLGCICVRRGASTR